MLVKTKEGWVGYDPKGILLKGLPYVEELISHLKEQDEKFGEIHLVQRSIGEPPLHLVEIFSTETLSQITKIFSRFANTLSMQFLEQI